jgi:hypothetical protein
MTFIYGHITDQDATIIVTSLMFNIKDEMINVSWAHGH